MKHMHSSGGQRGIALIEALVGIAIFSFGVLGLIGLQASMTKSQSAAKYRADAGNLAGELVGVMWGDVGGNLVNYGGDSCKAYPRCAEWASKVARTLPLGTSRVAVNIVQPGPSWIADVTVELRWSQPGESANVYRTQTRVQPQ